MPSTMRAQNVWLVRLCTLTTFVLALAWAPSVFAAAPMCGMHAQTIAAPLIGSPTTTDSLSAPTPCDEPTPLHATHAPNREAPRELSLPDLPIRALPFASHFGACPVLGRLPAAAAEQAVLAVGFARSIDRPPRG